MKLNGVTLKNFIEMSEDMKFKVLLWRNHPTVKKWMYTDDEIPLYSHLIFINNLKSLTDKQYFVASKEEQIGVIYFTGINKTKKECEFGLYANPFNKNTGRGAVLVKTGICYAFDILKVQKIKLEVFSDNHKALKIYKKFSFKEVDKKIINKREVICMELKNENR